MQSVSKRSMCLLPTCAMIISGMTVAWWAQDYVGRTLVMCIVVFVNIFIMACVFCAPQSTGLHKFRSRILLLESGILFGLVAASYCLFLIHVCSVNQLVAKLAMIRRGDPISEAAEILGNHVIATWPGGLYCRANPRWSKRHILAIDAIVEANDKDVVNFVTVFRPDN